ncbi:short-chain dehydrogenase/reductase SDR [Rhodobacteraceae bacterium KLH11]|nr:short-chain dehydrogenase/reductase SDR [Rhodobacteraceae bacterium KLH11]
MSQTVLITGVNSGFGKLIANTLAGAGFKVVGSMRDVAGRNASIAQEFRSKGIKIVEIDVTSDESVADAVNKAGNIDVLINNAGVGSLGWQDCFDIEDFKKIFDVNVFGVQRLTRGVLPHMKQQGNGTIIQISSVLGKFVLPFLGSYNATKHAVEGLVENYRVELSQFGIQSLIVQPGGFDTGFGVGLLKASDEERATSYGEYASAPEQMWSGVAASQQMEGAQNPQIVADAVLNLLNMEPSERPFRTTVDNTGMGTAVDGINKATEDAMQGVYGALEMTNLFDLRNE